MYITLTFGCTRGYNVVRMNEKNISRILEASDAIIVQNLIKCRIFGMKQIQSFVDGIEYIVELNT